MITYTYLHCHTLHITQLLYLSLCAIDILENIYLPMDSVLPKTVEKFVSETNVLCVAGGIEFCDVPLNPVK